MKLSVLLFLGFFDFSDSCIRTDGSATTAQCCSISIADSASTGRFLFNPALTSCPTEATFICSVNSDGSSTTTQIIIDGTTTVATGSGGTNSQVELTCDLTTQQWKYQETTTVTSIRCDV